MNTSKLNSRRAFIKSGSTIGIAASIAPTFLGCENVQEDVKEKVSFENDPEVTKILSEYVVNTKYEDLPQEAIDEAIRSIVNIVGCTIGGSNHETMTNAIEALGLLSGSGVMTIMGRNEKFPLQEAALLYGISSHVHDFDDTHLATIIHPAGPVASAIFPLSEYMKVSGEEFLLAFILGVEVECRIGLSVYPSHYQAGWHITGTAGVFGATAAVGKLLGLNVQQMVWALGIAATQSSGFKEMFGTMCKPFHPGNAARSGLMAAFLASKNFTSTNKGIEAKRSFAYVASPNRDFKFIVDGLGSTYEVVNNSYKPFSCGIVIHPIIDGCIQLRNENQLTGQGIKSIDLEVNKLVLELTGKKAPRTGLEGKFSVYHSTAIAIINGSALPKDYMDEVVNNSEVIALREKVNVLINDLLHEDQANIKIKLIDGTVFERKIEHAIGSANNPMTDAQLKEKFRNLADGIIGNKQRDDLIKQCFDIQNMNDVGLIVRRSVPL